MHILIGIQKKRKEKKNKTNRRISILCIIIVLLPFRGKADVSHIKTACLYCLENHAITMLTIP